MRSPSARITDLHACPAHPVPGTIVSAFPTVIVGKIPAARLGDAAVCGPIPNAITGGEMTVLIGKRPAARIGDPMAHGGKIATGFTTVFIGPITPPPSPPQAQALTIAAMTNAPICEECSA